MLRPTSRMVAMNSTRSLLSFLAIYFTEPLQVHNNSPETFLADGLRFVVSAVGRTRRERPAVISRPRTRAPASPTGAVGVPSSQSLTAQDRLTTARRSQHGT